MNYLDFKKTLLYNCYDHNDFESKLYDCLCRLGYDGNHLYDIMLEFIDDHNIEIVVHMISTDEVVYFVKCEELDSVQAIQLPVKGGN